MGSELRAAHRSWKLSAERRMEKTKSSQGPRTLRQTFQIPNSTLDIRNRMTEQSHHDVHAVEDLTFSII